MSASNRFPGEITITSPMTEPMSPARLAEIRDDDSRLHEGDAAPSTPEVHRCELLSEVDRLKAHLSEYIGWEPTVREEYEHACSVATRAEAVVGEFLATSQTDVNGFLFNLKRALEME